MVGELLEAMDVTSTVNSYCSFSTYGQPFSSCGLYTQSGYPNVETGQTLRLSWTCICGVGNAPTVDPITGACTQCSAGARLVKQESSWVTLQAVLGFRFQGSAIEWPRVTETEC